MNSQLSPRACGSNVGCLSSVDPTGFAGIVLGVWEASLRRPALTPLPPPPDGPWYGERVAAP